MKKISLLFAFIAFSLTSCSSDEPGPPGPQGPPGEPGLIGTVFEADVDFMADDYSVVIPIPENIEIYQTDVVLVYLLEAVDNNTGADIWTPLPQTFYLDEGEVVYNYNFTADNVAIFLDGTVDLSTLDAAFTTDQIFRIVIVPAGEIDAMSIDASNYLEVEAALDLEGKTIQKVSL